MYNILEVKIERKDNQLKKVTVLVEISKGDIRAIAATDIPCGGYMWLPPDSTISEELIQEVAAYGCAVNNRDKIFPDWKKRYFSSEHEKPF